MRSLVRKSKPVLVPSIPLTSHVTVAPWLLRLEGTSEALAACLFSRWRNGQRIPHSQRHPVMKMDAQEGVGVWRESGISCPSVLSWLCPKSPANPASESNSDKPLDSIVYAADVWFYPVLGSIDFPAIMLIFPLGCWDAAAAEIRGKASYVIIDGENPVYPVMLTCIWFHHTIIVNVQKKNVVRRVLLEFDLGSRGVRRR